MSQEDVVPRPFSEVLALLVLLSLQPMEVFKGSTQEAKPVFILSTDWIWHFLKVSAGPHNLFHFSTYEFLRVEI